MLVKLKVLSGALALNEFTIAELARYAGVKEQSVRTVLDREPGAFEELRKEKTGRRGGSTIVHRLRPDRAAALEEDISRIYNDLPARKRVEDPAPYLVALDVAEELLTRHFGETTDIDKRDEIVKLATKQIESVRGDRQQSVADSLPSDMIEKIDQRLAVLEAARNTCVELIDKQRGLIDHQRRMAAFVKERAEMLKRIEEAESRLEARPVIAATLPQHAYASRHAPAFAGSLRDCDVVVVATAGGAVVDSVRNVSKHERAHFVDLYLDPDNASDIDLVLKRLMNRKEGGHKPGFFELVYAVDSRKQSTPLLLSILKRLARAILPIGATDPIVLDTGYDAGFRNDVFRMQGLYAGNADQLDSGAMLEIVRKPLLKPVLTDIVASSGGTGPLVRS